MKRECLISRLNEPNIAHLYVIESDQNLINNIRVLCTRHPETLKYFVPEKLFWEIRNGEPVAMTAVCYDEYGRKLFVVDPLKVLSEQLREGEIYLPENEGVEIRLYVEGYELPAVSDPVEFLGRPDRYMKKGDRPQGRDTARGGDRPQGPDTTWRPRRRKRSVFKAVLLAAMIAAAAGVWFLRDTSVKRFEDRMSTSNYKEAVSIYNEEILGHESREERADPEVKDAVNAVRDEYLAEELSYEDACAYLNILAGIRKNELSEKAQAALDEVELYEVSSATLKEGIALMEEQEYLKAIEVLLRVEESSTVYEEAQDDISDCVERILGAADDAGTEEECLEAIAQIGEALELLPDNTDLTKGRDECRSKYTELVRSNAIAEADELVAAGDYAGAFARIDAGLEVLPEDDKLQQKIEDYRKSYVAYVTREALGRVDNGDFDGAGSFVEEASETYSCDALAVLYDEIAESGQWSAPKTSEYKAGQITYTEYPGEIKGKTKKKSYSIQAAESGICVWEFTRMETKLKAQFVVKGPDGKEIAKEANVADGSKVYCELEKGQKYTAEVTATKGEGSYVLLLGQEKPSVDVSDHDRVEDSLEIKGQINKYTFVPEISGTYRFALESGFPLVFRIYDPGNPKAIGGEMKGGDETEVEMTAGTTYRIEAAQSGKTGEYAFAIYKPEASADVTGRSIISGAVTYPGHKKAYTFKAAESGQYRITVGNMGDGCRVKLYVYSSLGDKLSGADELGNGESVIVQLEEGQGYQMQLTQSSGTGSYTITLAKE